MVTLQILVLPFLVRVRVPQQEKRSIVDFNNWALFRLLGYWLKIFSHRKVKLVDEYLFEGIQIVLLVEESAHFEPKNIIKGIVFEPIPSIKKVGFCDCYWSVGLSLWPYERICWAKKSRWNGRFLLFPAKWYDLLLPKDFGRIHEQVPVPYFTKRRGEPLII